MRDKRWSIALGVALGVLLLSPQVAAAGDQDETRMESLEERLMALEDKLEASEATVAAQRDMLQRQTPAVGQGSGLDAFFSNLEFGGHVAASYVYNFNNPDKNGFGTGVPGGQPYFQFNTDHNTFALDAVKLEMGKAASEPGSAGFQVDLLFGENANILSTGSVNVAAIDGRTAAVRNPGDTNVFVQEAYVSYNYDGIMLQAGKFETLLGFEVLDSHLNPNVTHGLLFTWAIPLFHTGMLASGNLGEGITWAAGVTNGFNNASDWGDNKGLLGRIGWSDSNTSVTLNTFIGSEQTRTRQNLTEIGDNNDRMQIYDLVAMTSPSEGMDLWLNVDYGVEEYSRDIPGGVTTASEDAGWFGVAAGIKMSLTEKTSLALRGEWLNDDGSSRLLGSELPPPPFGGVEEIDMYSATVTLGHQLTDNMMARLEYRHDVFDQTGPEGAGGNDFPKHDLERDDQQDVGLVEFTYVFD